MTDHRHEQSMIGPYCIICREGLKPPYDYWDNGQPNAPEGWEEYEITRVITEVLTFRAKSPEYALSHSKNMMRPGNGKYRIDSQYITGRKL